MFLRVSGHLEPTSIGIGNKLQNFRNPPPRVKEIILIKTYCEIMRGHVLCGFEVPEKEPPPPVLLKIIKILGRGP